MSKTWKQKDGRRILLTEMSDDHLKNAINMLNMHIRALEEEDLTDRDVHSGFTAYLIEEDISRKTGMRDAMRREQMRRRGQKARG